jgi:hypothetical protein
MSTAPQVLIFRDKVQRCLNDAVGRVEIDQNGDFTFQFGSSRIFIGLREVGEDRTVVDFVMPLLFDVPLSPDLFRYVATHGGYAWGHLSVEEKDGTGTLFYTHALLGDFLDPDEFLAALGAMVNTGDDLDNELQQRFGGTRFHDDVVEE